MVDLRTDRKVVIGKLMRSGLQLLASTTDELGDLEVLLREGTHLITELSRLASLLNFDLTCDRSEFVDVTRADFFLDSQKPQVELLLIGFLEEGDEEFARLEHL